MNLTIKDLTPAFMSETGHTLADYSVALAYSKDRTARTFTPIGTGVLVSRGKRLGILTARHCVCKPGPDLSLAPTGTDLLFLVLQRGRSVLVESQDVVKHVLATPQSEEYGPDLAFIEIMPGERLNSIKAVSSFWSLDKEVAVVARDFDKVGRLLATIGFPGVHYKTEIDGNTIHHEIRHMAYYFLIGPGDTFERSGWDYIENLCDKSLGTELPRSFAGVSGGPIWGLHFDVEEAKEKFCLTDFALLGICFYETLIENEQRELRPDKLRAHYIKSIYQLAWKGFAE